MTDKITCPAVFHGLCITAYGTINPCCSSRDIVHIDDVDSISEFWLNSQKYNQMRQDEFKPGWLPECITCDQKGKKGLVTRKDKFLKWYPAQNAEYSKSNINTVTHMDISFGNTCNQQCIMCSSNFSSQWLKWDQEFDKTDSWFRANSNTIRLKNWSLSYKQLDDIASLVSNETKMIEIKGGEPLYDKRFEYFVTLVLEKNPKVVISTNTNGSFFTEKTVKFLNTIENFRIDVSIDGTGKVYEWIRNYSWQDLQKNFQYAIKNLDHKITANYTTSKYNVDHFLRFYKWCEKMNKKSKKPIGINFTQVVTTPKHQNPVYADKDRIIDGLNQLQKIRSDPGRFASKEFSIYTPRIDLMIKYLNNCLDHKPTDKELKKVKDADILMSKVRGYEFDPNM